MSFTDVITRPGDPAPLVPQPVVAQVIQELPAQSAVLANARQARMSTKTNRMPVLSVLPTAYFVNGEAGGAAPSNGLKQTTKQDWENVVITAEELAVIVPIPQAYIDDADIPIWDEVRPRVVEAFGSAIDGAALFGINRPATWATDLFTAATTAPLTVVAPGDDLGQSVASVGTALARNGYRLNGFAAAPGFAWNLVGYRNAQGMPIYQPDPAAPVGVGRLYGYPIQEVDSGGWNPADASLIAGDWTKAIVGLRQDMTFQIFTEGVITDAAGNIVLNLMQQDSVALRAVMRVGFATANPITQLTKGKAAGSFYPFAALGPVEALGGPAA